MSWVATSTTGPLVCGHRGAPAIVPENTMPSFHSAVDRGATWLEFDVRPTADGELIIHHDPDTAAGVNIATTKRDQLPSSIPDFGALARALPAIGLDIEMKTNDVPLSLGAFADLVVHEIEAHCDESTSLIVTSFDADALAEVRSRRSDLPTGLIYRTGNDSAAIARAVADGHVAIAPSIRLLRASTVEKAREASLGIVTWTVNTPKQVRKAAKLGVDMIIGDDPAVIAQNL